MADASNPRKSLDDNLTEEDILYMRVHSDAERMKDGYLAKLVSAANADEGMCDMLNKYISFCRRFDAAIAAILEKLYEPHAA